MAWALAQIISILAGYSGTPQEKAAKWHALENDVSPPDFYITIAFLTEEELAQYIFDHQN